MMDMSIPEDMMWKKYKWTIFEEIIDSLKETEQKLEAVREWWLLFNQCIDSEAAKDKLEEILGFKEDS